MSLKLNERYPARFNNPTAGYPQGSFKNRTTPTAKDGSYLEKDWANDKEGFFQSLLSAAGVTANGSVDAVGASQFFDALQALKQNQAGTAFTATGPSAALVLTPVPSISSYSVGQRFRVKFNRASTGSDTINISGIGPKYIKQYDNTGSKIPAKFAIDQLADIEYDGTDIVLLDQLPESSNNVVGIAGAAKNLKASATGTNANVSITADEIVLESDSNLYQTVRSVSITPNFSISGVSGLDTGVVSASTWYSVWVIWSSTSGVAGLFSLSATSPVMPSGWTHKALVGWVRTDSTANKYPLSFLQRGRIWQYKVAAGSNVLAMPLVASGTGGNPTVGPVWATVGINSFVAPGASAITLSLSILVAGSTAIIVAPNNSYGVYNSGTNPPPGGLANGAFLPGPSQVRFLLEESVIYWASDRPETRIFMQSFELNI